MLPQLRNINLREIGINLTCPVSPLARLHRQQASLETPDADKTGAPVLGRCGIQAHIVVSGRVAQHQVDLAQGQCHGGCR